MITAFVNNTQEGDHPNNRPGICQMGQQVSFFRKTNHQKSPATLFRVTVQGEPKILTTKALSERLLENHREAYHDRSDLF
jgi:hypothetical protein